MQNCIGSCYITFAYIAITLISIKKHVGCSTGVLLVDGLDKMDGSLGGVKYT